MNTSKKIFNFIIIVLVLFPSLAWDFSSANAAVPIAVEVKQGDTLAIIARDHSVSVGDLMKANSISGNPHDLAAGTWLYLPAKAHMPDQGVFGISGPSETELQFILAELEDVTVYRIIGRKYYHGSWMGVPVVVFATGGSMNNPSIGVIAGATNFNMQRFCYQGIGGAGHGVDIGDVVVATGVIPGIGHGNIAPLQTPLGDVVVGQFWSYFWGEPVISDQGYAGQLVLTPDQGFMDKVAESAQKVELPTVNFEVADYVSMFYDEPIDVYQSALRFGWTSTGPFVTSDLYLRQLVERSAILAGINGLPAPEFFAVDMEDHGAIHAAVEVGIEDWCVIRSTVDLARERIPGESPYGGVPWEEANDPAQPWKWLDENKGMYGYFEDWDYFYRLPYLVMKQIVADWGLN